MVNELQFSQIQSYDKENNFNKSTGEKMGKFLLR